jgi:hypothetical protein
MTTVAYSKVDPSEISQQLTADNIQLRCRAHNQYEAHLFFEEMLVRERSDVDMEGAAAQSSLVSQRDDRIDA